MRVPYRVCFADTDAGGVVYNGAYLRIFEVARNELARHAGLSLAQYAAEGIYFVVRAAELEYRAPALFDDLLEIEVVARREPRATLRFRYQVRVVERCGRPYSDPAGAQVSGSTLLVCCRADTDRTAVRPIRLPDAVADLCRDAGLPDGPAAG